MTPISNMGSHCDVFYSSKHCIRFNGVLEFLCTTMHVLYISSFFLLNNFFVVEYNAPAEQKFLHKICFNGKSIMEYFFHWKKYHDICSCWNKAYRIFVPVGTFIMTLFIIIYVSRGTSVRWNKLQSHKHIS